MMKCVLTKCMANDDFSGPLRRPDSENPILVVCRIWGPGHLRDPGVRLGRNLGSPSIEAGGSSQRAVLTPPPLELKAHPPLVCVVWDPRDPPPDPPTHANGEQKSH